jgi:hypothetical protein
MIKSIGGSRIDWGTSIISSDDDGYIAVGTTESFGLDSNSIYISYVDSNGVVGWTNVYGGWGNDYGSAAIKLQSNDFLVAGGSSSFHLSSGDKWDPAAHPFIEWDGNFYLSKITNDGFVHWEKVYGDSTLKELSTSVMTVPDGFVMAGYQTGDSPEGTSFNDEFYVVKTDPNGEVIWQNSYGSTNADRAYSIVSLANGDYIIG